MNKKMALIGILASITLGVICLVAKKMISLYVVDIATLKK